MKILLTNDDGYQSEGLVLLCRMLAEAHHEVYVVAPDGQRSAMSHCANFYKKIYIILPDCRIKRAIWTSKFNSIIIT